LRLLAAVLVLTAAGALTRLPILNPGPRSELTLSNQELQTLAKLPEPVVLEAQLSTLGAIRFGPLLELYAKASPKVKVQRIPGPGRVEAQGEALELTLPDRVTLRSGPLVETVSPLTQLGLAQAFYRLISPSRVVYNLVGDGEKSTQDASPQGLLTWSTALEKRQIFLRDHYWAPGSPLPPGGSALILAGPRTQLDPIKTAELLRRLAQGGRLMVLSDPLVPGLDPDTFSSLGLTLSQGLVVDPETAWAGTDDLFPVSYDFPAHPATLGLRQPVVWPLVGAITRAETLAQEPDPDNALAGPTWVVARSSPTSFLETDRAALARRQPRLDPGVDPEGPLTLATATSLQSGGRLALVADSDLAANAFIANPGNLALLEGLMSWLLGAEAELPAGPQGTFFNVTQSRARAMFWLPVVVWPLLCGLAWLVYWRRRRGLS
jgi:hypothetical protein